MTETITNVYCDLCGKNYDECNKDDKGTYKDSATIDIEIDHKIHSTQDKFYDSKYGNVSTLPIHMDLCLECFCKLMYALRKPQERLYPVLKDIPFEYYSGKYYDEMSEEDYKNTKCGNLINKGFSNHDCCSYYACPECNQVYDGYNVPVKRYMVRTTDKSNNTTAVADRFDLFTCSKCGYKMRILGGFY